MFHAYMYYPGIFILFQSDWIYVMVGLDYVGEVRFKILWES